MRPRWLLSILVSKFSTIPRLTKAARGLAALSESVSNDGNKMQYDRLHRLLAEGNFVLSVSEGFLNGVHSSFYDLYRIANGKLVEHWDTTEAIPPTHRMEERQR